MPGGSILVDNVLLEICQLSSESPDATPELMADLRAAQSLIAMHAVGPNAPYEHAMVLLMAALGRLGRYGPDLPYTYHGPAAEGPGWLGLVALQAVAKQIVGLTWIETDPEAVAASVAQSATRAVKLGLAKEEPYDTWHPGMRSGSGWRYAVQPTPYGIAKARSLAGRMLPVPTQGSADPQPAPTVTTSDGDRFLLSDKTSVPGDIDTIQILRDSLPPETLPQQNQGRCESGAACTPGAVLTEAGGRRFCGDVTNGLIVGPPGSDSPTEAANSGAKNETGATGPRATGRNEDACVDESRQDDGQQRADAQDAGGSVFDSLRSDPEIAALIDQVLALTPAEQSCVLRHHLLLYAQAYYMLVETVATSPMHMVDMVLNGWYLQIVEVIRALLALPELEGFPGGFEPAAPNLFPYSELDVVWEEGLGASVLDFLGRTQAYATERMEVDPRNRELIKAIIEVCRLKLVDVSAIAARYRQRAEAALRRTLHAMDQRANRRHETGGTPSGGTSASASTGQVPAHPGEVSSQETLHRETEPCARSAPQEAVNAGPIDRLTLKQKKDKIVPPGPCVEIGQPGLGCRVLGQDKPALTDGEYAVIQALLKAGPDGLTKDVLELVRGSARRILKRLRNDSDWAQVIIMPGRTNGRYRLRTADPPAPTNDHL